MLRQRARLVSSSVYLCDLILIVTGFLFVYWSRNTLLSEQYGGLYPIQDYLWLLLFILPLWSFLLYYFRLYESYRTKPVWAEPWGILKAAFWGTLLIGALIFVFKLHYVSRLLIVLFGATAFMLLSVERLAIRIIARQVRKRGYNYRNIIIVGSGRRSRELANVVKEHRDWGLRLLGIVVDNPNGTIPKVGKHPVLGKVEDLLRILENEVVDEIIFAVSRKRLEELEDLFLICEERGVRTHVAVNFFPHMIAKVHLDDLHGIPLLTFTTTPSNEFLLAIKRAFDILVSGILLITLSSIMFIIAIAIKATSRGSILFKQTRVGLNGRRFTLYKFRSMVQDAERKKQELLHFNEMSGPVFKIKDDPRLTPIGKFLRKISLDELPQLINVFKGNMSIVGPRPPLPEEVTKYEPWQRRRLSMKPGITCLWQINGRNEINDFDQWMKLDLEYIDNWSLQLDFKIFLKTIPVVLLGRGAS